MSTAAPVKPRPCTRCRQPITPGTSHCKDGKSCDHHAACWDAQTETNKTRLAP